MLFLSVALASPLNPFTTATSSGTFLLNPYVYVYADGSVSPLVYVSTGLGSHADVYVGAGGGFGPDGFGGAGIEVMPRYFFNPDIAVAAHVLYSVGSPEVTIAPEVHAMHSWGNMAFTANVGWRPTFGGEGFDKGSVVAIVAPEVFFSDRVSAYLEIDPTIPVADLAAASLTLVPGIGLTLGAESNHFVSVGVQVPAFPEISAPSVGMWYAVAFD